MGSPVTGKQRQENAQQPGCQADRVTCGLWYEDTRLRGRRRKRAVMMLGGLALLLFGALAATHLGPTAQQRLALLHWQSECLRYERASDSIAYESDPDVGASLVEAGPEYTRYELRGFPPMSTAFRPRAWSKFTTDSEDLPDLAYLHRRTIPAGPNRLVAVSLGKSDADDDMNLHISARYAIITPAGLLSGPDVVNGTEVKLIPVGWQDRVTVYWGVTSRTDKSRFSIECSVGGQRYRVAGQLVSAREITFDVMPVSGEGDAEAESQQKGH